MYRWVHMTEGIHDNYPLFPWNLLSLCVLCVKDQLAALQSPLLSQVCNIQNGWNSQNPTSLRFVLYQPGWLRCMLRVHFLGQWEPLSEAHRTSHFAKHTIGSQWGITKKTFCLFCVKSRKRQKEVPGHPPSTQAPHFDTGRCKKAINMSKFYIWPQRKSSRSVWSHCPKTS